MDTCTLMSDWEWAEVESEDRQVEMELNNQYAKNCNKEGSRKAN